VVQDLEIKVVAADGHESHGFLDNAFNSYRLRPENRADIIQTYAAGFFETANPQDEAIDRERIVPILKPKGWIDEINKSMKTKRDYKGFEAVHEPYNDELMVVYAEDTPANMRYLTPSNLASLKLEPNGLLKMACDNLQKLLPEPSLQLEDGAYRIRAGGDYDASLLLVDAFWETANLQVAGEVVAAVPARDFLVVTGSKNEAGMRRIKQAARVVASKASYRLTEKLFVRRDGRFVSFEG
jgi:uncharacterized protein YtpQ (UPF0354 family)